MKIFKLFSQKEEIQERIIQTFKRFPLVSLASVIVTMMFFILIYDNPPIRIQQILWKSIISLIVVFFLSVGVTLYCESKKASAFLHSIGYIVSLLFAGSFYLFLGADLDNHQTITYIILTLFGVISLIFSAPYINYIYSGKYKEISFYIYFYKISVVFFTAFVLGGALALGSSLAVLAIDILFELSLHDIHGTLISISLSFITPIYALSQLPKPSEFESSKFQANIFFNFLILYIAIPFIYVYFFILYAYTLKVLLNFQDWPKGEVSWMVIGFSLFGYITYIFSYIFQTKKISKNSSFMQLFRQYFPLLVLPQAGMLFYAIFLRISQYDLTMNRYFVVIFGLWLVIVSLYLSASKIKSLLILPVLLTLLTLIVSIGPWSIYNYPLHRQTQRLENNLSEAGILHKEEIRPLKEYSDIDQQLSSEIYDGIEYVCRFDNCKNVTSIFSSIYEDLLEQYESDYEKSTGFFANYGKDEDITYILPNKWEIVTYVTDQIKVQKSNSYRAQNSGFIYITSDRSIFPLNVQGYDYAIEIDSYYQQKQGEITVKYNSNLESLTILDGDFVESVTLESYFEGMKELENFNGNTSLTGSQSEHVFETERYLGKLIITNARIAVEKNQENISPYLSGIVLLKLK